MDGIAVRHVMVVDDEELARAVRNDEASEEELSEYMQDGCPVSYTLPVDDALEVSLLCRAAGLEPGEENELADVDVVATSWDPNEVAEGLEILTERLEDPDAFAAALLAEVTKLGASEEPCSVADVADVLGKLDKGYEPEHDAHLAVGAAAWLVRHILAFRVAERNDAWVVSF